ncbi:unnamed protein product [Mytilus coruscus]|uniref:Uncharacterized protein n=1 Tax=Mytilus coruscus TaxID=42192 RepID=A0A6J8BQL1_MYTCO|nr:unnamed protein product [Mytilus coruscus]
MKTVVYLCLVGVSHGFLFNLNTHGGSKTITAKTDVRPECIDWAHNGTCDFYDCFEQRFPCGSSGYALGYGGKYCRKFQQSQFRSLFNTAGQVFLDKMSKCEMDAVLPFYEQQSITCSTEYDLVFKHQEDCYIQSGYCDVVLDNFDGFLKTFDRADFLNFKLINQVLNAAKRCHVDISQAIISKYLGR